MQILLYAISVVMGYILGSVNVSVIVSKIVYKGDVRKHGSGNAGATNMARVYGPVGGMIVLVGDFIKAVAAIGFSRLIADGVLPGNITVYEICGMLAGIFCIIGHAFPVFFKFRGGKGVTVGAAIALMSDWKALVVIVIVFIAVFATTRIVSISSMSGGIALIITVALLFVFNGLSLERLILCVFASVLVIALHHSNIKRLIHGEEKEFKFKKSDKSAKQESVEPEKSEAEQKGE